MERVICLAIGYVFGLFQTAFIYGKMNHIDIREHGSGNAGTTNALRVLGKKAGLIVFLGDVFKCFFAVELVRLLFKHTYPDILPLLSLYAAAGAILGHNFPFYLQFKGGKGIAATAGLILAFHWPFLIVAIPVFCILFFTTHYVSVGSLAGYIGFITELIILGQKGYFGMSQPALLEMYVVGIFLMIMAFVRHKENIKRLFAGTERKTYLFKANKED